MQLQFYHRHQLQCSVHDFDDDPLVIQCRPSIDQLACRMGLILFKKWVVLAQKFWGGALPPSALSSQTPFSPFSETEKDMNFISFKPTFEIYH